MFVSRFNKRVCAILCSFSIMLCAVTAYATDRFTKLDIQGNDLPKDAAAWTMVRDNTTGLTWEVKSIDDSLNDKDKIFKWIKVKKEFINELNKQKFGGFDDWRIPKDKELQTLLLKGSEPPYIDMTYFPHTEPGFYWAFYYCGDGSKQKEKIDFGLQSEKSRINRIRAVRGKELE